jgi:polyisoprenoid-binding protein YceI
MQRVDTQKKMKKAYQGTILCKKALLFALILGTMISLSLSAEQQSAQKSESEISGTYRIVSEGSKIIVKTGTSGMLGFLGHSHSITPKVFTGEVSVTAKEAAPASLRVEIDATSLKETGDFNQKDRETIEEQMHGEVLDTKKYPNIILQSNKVSYSKSGNDKFDVQIEGELSLHGVTQNVTIPAKITIEGNSLRAAGKFEIERKDYKIETASAGGGAVKVANKLEITFDVLARR